MTDAFTDADAQRILNVIDERTTRAVRAEGRRTYGVVAAIYLDTGYAAVYLYGDTTASTDFRVPPHLEVRPGDTVLVYLNDRGDRLIEMVMNPYVNLRQRGVNTTSAGSGTAGYWGKVAHGRIGAQYRETQIVGVVGGFGNGTTSAPVGIVRVRLKQQAALGNQPLVAIDWLGRHDFYEDYVAVVVTSCTASETLFEVHVKVRYAYENATLAPLYAWEGGFGEGVVFDYGASLAASLPSGTAYYATDAWSWAAASFENSWSQYGGTTWQPAGYRMDPDGWVHLRGMVTGGTVGSPIFTLSSGYRPEKQTLMASICNSGLARVDALASGSVTPQAPSTNGWLSLDGLIFKAYQ